MVYSEVASFKQQTIQDHRSTSLQLQSPFGARGKPDYVAAYGNVILRRQMEHLAVEFGVRSGLS